MVQTSEKQRPPYASPGDTDRLFDRVRNIGDPGTVDTKWVQSFNLAGSQPEAVVSVLKWLGVIDKDGKSQGVWNELRLPATRTETLQRLMKDAYADVFSRIDVSEASREDLEGAFISAYESGSTSRPLGCFLALCRHAGIETKAQQRRSAASGSPRSAQRPRPATVAKTNGNGASSASEPKRSQRIRKQASAGADSQLTVSVSLNLEIPGDWSDEQVERRIAATLHAVESA